MILIWMIWKTISIYHFWWCIHTNNKTRDKALHFNISCLGIQFKPKYTVCGDRECSVMRNRFELTQDSNRKSSSRKSDSLVLIINSVAVGLVLSLDLTLPKYLIRPTHLTKGSFLFCKSNCVWAGFKVSIRFNRIRKLINWK